MDDEAIIDIANAEIDKLEQEYRALQLIFGLVLQHVGEVRLPDELVVKGLPPNSAIYIEEDVQNNCHRIGLTQEEVVTPE